MVKYKCIFEFKALQSKFLETISGRFSDFQDGFWLDEECEYTDDYSKWKYWIPSHKIQYIEKMDEIRPGKELPTDN